MIRLRCLPPFAGLRCGSGATACSPTVSGLHAGIVGPAGSTGRVSGTGDEAGRRTRPRCSRRVGCAGRPADGRRAAGPSRPAVRLSGARRARRRRPCPALAGAGAVRRPAGRRLRARAAGRQRARRAAGLLERAVGTEPVLTAATTAALFRAVADRWAGNFVDVVRLGVPPRHARGRESAATARRRPDRSLAPGRGGVGPLPRRRGLPAAVGRAGPARAVWSALPGRGLAGPAGRSDPGRARRRPRRAGGRARRRATSPGWTPRSRRVLGPGRHVALVGRPRPGASGTGAGWRCGAGGPARSSAPGRPRTRRCRPRPARDLGRRRRPARRAARARTRTPATCWCCGPR